ncbi:MAG: SIMPL domain-containing protein [Candidatus Micrarchaeaceae archaeon]
MAKESTFWPLVTLIAVLLLGAVGIALGLHSNQYPASSAGTGNVKANYTITVTATGYAAGQPSQATMYITINGTGSTVQDAVSNVSSTANAFNKTIYKYVNGNLSNIQTSSYYVQKLCNSTYYISVPQEYQACSSNFQYQAEEQLIVLIPDQANLSAAIGSISAIPNVYINSIYLQLSNAQAAKLKKAALSAAMENATTQAEEALGAGYNISIANISIDNYYLRSTPFYYSGAGPAVPSPIIYQGTSSVSATITVSFSYAKG